MKAEKTPEKPARKWTQNPQKVKSNILNVAIKVFSKNGLTGARIDEIAAKTETSKRMIYYYFGDKEGLYKSALEAAYASMRGGEKQLDLANLPAREALKQLVQFTFEHHRKNPDFIRIIMIENTHNARYILESDDLRRLNYSVIERLRQIITRGEKEGVFRPGIHPVALHWHISALSFFNVSNQQSFSANFGNEIFSGQWQNRLKADAVDMILQHVSAEKVLA